MNRSFLRVSILAFSVFIGRSPASGQSQSSTPSGWATPLDFIHALNFESCRQDLPAPTLLAEPRFTQGTRNVIGIKLPALSAIPFSPDTIRSPIVITLVNDGSASPLKFPRPVQLGEDVTEFEIVTVLKSGGRYSYTTALFLPICKIPCSAVTDTSQLELHCSAYRDTVFSTQDAVAPVVTDVLIPQLNESRVAGWWNQSSIQISASVSDPAGVWRAFLYRRSCSQSEWTTSVVDTTFPSEQVEGGEFFFGETVNALFAQNLADGCYEFRIDGRDATHTPESCFPNFTLAGNGGQPVADAPAQVRINIDTRPPSAVNVSGLQVSNTVVLNWSASVDPEPGIGLAGYRISRNGLPIDTVGNNVTTYSDNFSAEAPSAVLIYQVQPVDSLDNVQTAGGKATVAYVRIPRIAMAAEPEFTPGFENQVCWSGSPNIDSFSIFIAENCDLDQKTKVDVSDTCFTFVNLKDGVTYCYWVEAVDQQQRPVVSDTVRSTQDASAPEITNLEVDEIIDSNGRSWVNRREVQIHVSAVDSLSGSIQSLKIFENDQVTITFVPTAPSPQIDTVIPLTLTSAECEEIEIRVTVEDGAGNTSRADSIELKLDATPPPPVTGLGGGQLSHVNGIRIVWSTTSDAAGCSGLSGYRVVRNGEQIATAGRDSTGFNDNLPDDTSSQTFTYQVQPLDSLNNIQNAGPEVGVDYQAAPSVVIQPLPEFTPGLTNEICWTLFGSLVELQLFVNAACDTSVDRVFSMGSLLPGESCEPVAGLSDGVRYCYWLAGRDAQQRIVRSAVVSSIQDNTPPAIDAFSFPAGDPLNGQIWAFERDIELRIVAHDAVPGEIWRYEIIENNSLPSPLNHLDSSAVLEKNFMYNIHNQEAQPARIELQAQVFDGAGNPSTLAPVTIFFQGDLPSMFAYPNPYNPLKGDGIIIRLRDANESELKIYDFFGNLVQTLTLKANSRDFSWDGRNGDGEMVANGGYICIGTRTKARFKIGVAKQNF